ncbi:MAG: hypothetical protein ACD_57C00002G0001, partial [uncultured bacterium]
MNFGIVVAKDNPPAKKLAGEITKYVKSKGHEVLDKDRLKGSDLFLTLGGDGTLLHTACENIQFQVPFVGINLGKLGFLTATEASDWKTAIDKLIDGKYVVSERITLDTEIGAHSRSALGRNFAHSGSEEKVFRALNEVVVKGLYRVVDLQLSLNDQKFLKIVGDGVIIATQTGSTAYSLSAGGPIVDPDLDSLLITPINSTGLPMPSAVLSSESVVNIEVLRGDDISLIIDGQEHT